MSEQANLDSQLRAAFEPQYTLERELKGGGMSRVFLAVEHALNRRVVIKVLPPELVAGVNHERFRREIQLAAQLQHPHIVPLYSAGERGNLLYYTMPFAEGASLRDAIHAGERFSPRDVIGLLHDVVDGLAYAHERGIIHRDIKPGNVLRSGSHAVVTDFGVAKAISASMPANEMTSSGMAIGTPAYMAPEQLAGDPAADHRVDIYAVGLLAYELLTGQAPFVESSPQATMAAQLTRAPEAIEKTRRDVPSGLSKLVMRCLAKEPEKRPQSAVELLQALDALDSESRAAGMLSARGRSRSLLVGAAALLVVAYGAVRLARGPSAEPAASAASATPGREARREGSRSRRAAPELMTREDSLAVAEAVLKRLPGALPLQQSKPVAPAEEAALRLAMDSLRVEIQDAILDSLARGARQVQGSDPWREVGRTKTAPTEATRAASGGRGETGRSAPDIGTAAGAEFAAAALARTANMGSTRRIVIAEYADLPEHPEYAAVNRVVADTLRKVLLSRRRFVPVPQDSVREALAKSSVIENVASDLKADVFAALRIHAVGADSVSLIFYVHDLAATRGYGRRVATMPPVSVANPLAGIDRLLAAAISVLDEIDHAPREGVLRSRGVDNPTVRPAPAATTPARRRP